MKQSGNYRHLTIEIEEHLAHVTINRPPVNALNKLLVEELALVAKTLSAIRDVWFVVLTAVGHVFCAGADLKERNSLEEKDVLQTVKKIQNMVYAWAAIPQPVVIGIQGSVFGGGLELALTGDIIVASETAVFGFPEVRLGVIPGAGGTQLLALLTSQSIAKKWILSAKRFSAREALEDHVINFVFSAKSFDREFSSFLADMLSNAPLAMRQAKKSIQRSLLASLRKGMNYESACYETIIATHDRREAIRAFLEKRSPQWQGK